jgi:octaprenyl-diphosphate synthase
MYDYGMAIGISFQIVDDALDYSDEEKTGKPVGGDLQERKITLPLSHLLKQANVRDRKRLDLILAQAIIEKPQIEEVTCLMKRYGSIDYTLVHSREYAAKALQYIENFPDSELRQSLAGIANYIVSRQD